MSQFEDDINVNNLPNPLGRRLIHHNKFKNYEDVTLGAEWLSLWGMRYLSCIL